MHQPDHRNTNQRQNGLASRPKIPALISTALACLLLPSGSPVFAAPETRQQDASESKIVYGDELYQPSVGQEGKNVIWVPTPDPLMLAMLETLNIQPNDILYDLGSGDGKIVISAAQRYKIQGVGIEYNPSLVALARRNAVRAGVQDKTSFIQGDIFKEDFSRATVIALYLLPDLNLKLKPILLSMRPGTRVVSNTFNMGSWPADTTIEIAEGNRAYYWVVPAKVQGRWQLDDAGGNRLGELNLRQEFQLLRGTLQLNGKTLPILSGRMKGENINIVYQSRKAGGPPSQGTLQGTVEAGLLQGILTGEAGQQQLSGRRVTGLK